jgi:hypothetical protein
VNQGCFLAGPLVALSLLLLPSLSDAKVKTKLSLDASAAVPLTPERTSPGAGGGVRFGVELDALVLSLTPEIGADYHAMSGDLAPKVLRGFGGARLMLGALVRPGIFAHVGYGYVTYGSVGGVEPPSRAAPSYDGGLALDLTFIPKIDLGAHLGYAVVARNDDGAANGFLFAGAHVAFVF